MPRKSTTKGSSTDTSKKLTLLLDRPIKVYFQDLNITIEIIGDAIYINNPSKKEIPDAFFNTEYFQTISRRKINYVFREYTLGNSLPQRISDRVYKIGNKHTLGDLLKSIKDNKGSLYSMKDVSNTYIDVENSENIKKTLDDCKKDNFTQSGRPVLESKYDSALKTLSVTLLPEYMNQDGITELKTQILDQIQVKTMDIQSVSFIYQHTFMGRIVNDIISINIGTTDKSKRTEAFLNVMNGIKIENISKNSIPDFLVEVDNAKTKSSRTQAKTILGNQALTPEVISNVCILTTEEDYFNSEENIKSVLSGLSKIPYKDKSIKKLNIKTTKGRDNVIDLSSFSEDKCPDIMKIITDTLSESANFTDILNSNYLKTKNFCILLADGIQKMQDIIAVVPDIVGMGELGKIAYKKYYTAEDSQKCDRILENLKAFQQVLQAAASGSSVFNNYINKINNIDYVAQYVQDNFEKFLDYPPETVKYIFNKIIETSSAIEADTALTTKKQKKEKFLDEMKKVIEEKEAEYQILFDGEVKNIVVFQDVVNEKSTQQYLIYKQEIPTGAVRNDFDKSGAIFYPATEDDLSSTNRDKYNFVVVNKAIADTNKNASFLNSVCKSLNFESGNVIFHDIPEFKDDNGAAKKSVYLSDSNPFEDNQVIKAEEVKSNIGSQFKEKYPETYLQMNGQFYRVMKKHANDKYYNTHATYDEIVSSPNKYIFIPYTTVPTRQYLRISRLSKDNIEFKAEYNQDLCSKSIIQGQCGTEELYIESANVKIKSIGKYDGLNYDPSSIQIDTKEYDLFEYDSKSHTTRYIRPAEPLDYSKKQYVYRNGSDYYSIIYIVDENNTLKYYTKKLDMATDPALEKKLDDIVKTEIESFDVDEIKKRETDNFTEVTIGGETYFVVKKMYSDTAKNKYYALTTDDVKSDDLFKSDDYALVQYKDDKVYKLEQISETTSGIEYKYNKKTAIAQATWLDGQDFDKKIKIDLTNKKISISLDEFVMNDTFDKDTINKFLTTLSQIINNEKSLQEGVSMEYTFGDKKWEITNVDFTFGKTGYKRTYDKVVEIFSSLKEQKAEEKIVEREIEKHKAVHLFNDCFEIQNDTLIIKKIPDQTSLIFNGKEHQDIMMMELLQTYNYNLIDKIKKIKFDLTLPDSSNENQEIDISAIENSIEKKRFISNICLVLGQVSLQTNKTDSSLYLKDKIKQYKDELSSYKSDTDKTLHDELTKVIQDYISDSTNPQIDLSLFEDYLAASIGGREIPIDNTLIKLEHVKQIEQTLSLIQQNLENTVSREEVQKKFDVIQKQLMEDRNLLNCSDDSLKFLQNILQGNNLKIWNFAEKEIVNILEIILNIHKAQDSATKDAELTTFIKNPFDPDPLSGSETCVQYINSYRKKLWEESSLGQTIYSIFKNQEIYQYINLNNAFNFYQDKDRKQLTNFFNALNKEQKEIINCTEGSQLFGLYFNYIPNFPKEEFGYIQDMILYINKVEDINKIIDGINYLTTYNASSRTFYDSYYKHF